MQYIQYIYPKEIFSLIRNSIWFQNLMNYIDSFNSGHGINSRASCVSINSSIPDDKIISLNNLCCHAITI